MPAILQQLEPHFRRAIEKINKELEKVNLDLANIDHDVNKDLEKLLDDYKAQLADMRLDGDLLKVRYRRELRQKRRKSLEAAKDRLVKLRSQILVLALGPEQTSLCNPDELLTVAYGHNSTYEQSTPR